ncbi:MAG: class I SAM-dependent methyltransferase [Patescibacteria group bacterium]
MLRDHKQTMNLSNGVMVDLGAGPGTSIPMFINNFKLQKCILVDSSTEMNKIAKNVLSCYGDAIEIQRADLRDDQICVPNASVDLVISFSALSYLKFLDNSIEESSRMHKANGLLLFNDFFHNKKPSIIGTDAPKVISNFMITLGMNFLN